MHVGPRFSSVVSLVLLVLVTVAWGQTPKEPSLTSRLAEAKEKATQGKHLLRYQFAEGEAVQWKVTHTVTVETTIQGTTQTARTQSQSNKVWTVQDVDADGNITFVYSVSKVSMWRKASGSDEVRYDSDTDKTPPPGYEQVANSVGVPIATVKVSPSGEVLHREGGRKPANSGLGEIVRPLPDQPVAVGHEWHTMSEIPVRLQSGQIKRIKTRLAYTLRSVKAGVATIDVKTEVLTPVNDPKIESQLVQQVTNGVVKFDVDAGRVLSQEIDWDDTVVGFNGAGSSMNYLARFAEELVPSSATARKSGPGVR